MTISHDFWPSAKHMFWLPVLHDWLCSSDAKRQHVELVKDRRLFDQRITQLNDECEKLMIEKFGRVVDIEKLETVTVNRQIEEVKDRLSMADVQFAANLQLWQVRCPL